MTICDPVEDNAEEKLASDIINVELPSIQNEKENEEVANEVANLDPIYVFEDDEELDEAAGDFSAVVPLWRDDYYDGNLTKLSQSLLLSLSHYFIFISFSQVWTTSMICLWMPWR